jgi:hypothetical protein
MIKKIVSILVTVLFLGISFCKDNSQSKVDRLNFNFIGKAVDIIPKKFDPTYANRVNALLADTLITSKRALQNGQTILEMSNLSSGTRHLMALDNWLPNLINPRSGWREGAAAWQLTDVTKLKGAVQKFFGQSPETFQKMIDSYYATQSKGLYTQLGLKVRANNKVIEAIEFLDPQNLAVRMDNLNQTLRSKKIDEKYHLINLPQEMRLRNIRSRSDEEYISNLAKKGVFELHDFQVDLGVQPYRVHQLLGITPTIYHQNRLLAQKANVYIEFMENLILTLKKSKGEGVDEATESLKHFKKEIRLAIDNNLKNAGEIQFFLFDATLQREFLSTPALQKQYLESMYNTSFFNKPFEQILQRLVIDPTQIETGIYARGKRTAQVESFFRAHPEMKGTIVKSTSVEGIFANARQRQNTLENVFNTN